VMAETIDDLFGEPGCRMSQSHAGRPSRSSPLGWWPETVKAAV
jgi:hypothetical protein